MQDIEPDTRPFDPDTLADKGFGLAVRLDPPAATFVAFQNEHQAVTREASGLNMMGADRHGEDA